MNEQERSRLDINRPSIQETGDPDDLNETRSNAEQLLGAVDAIISSALLTNRSEHYLEATRQSGGQ